MEMTLEMFKSLLNRHDWFFNYSDDHNVWVKGNNQSKEIDRAYKMLTAQGLEVEAREMFNELSPDGFHMKEPKV